MRHPFKISEEVPFLPNTLSESSAASKMLVWLSNL